jgi:hypothetical protein
MSAVFLAAALAACLWAAVSAPQPTSYRYAPHLGIAGAIACVAGFVLLTQATYHVDLTESPQQMLATMTALWVLFVPSVTIFLVALTAGLIGRSLRSGLLAGFWAGAICMPLMYGLWLFQSLSMYSANGGLLLFGDGAPEAENLAAAINFCLFIVVLFAPPCAVLGATLSTKLRRTAV